MLLHENQILQLPDLLQELVPPLLEAGHLLLPHQAVLEPIGSAAQSGFYFDSLHFLQFQKSKL